MASDAPAPAGGHGLWVGVDRAAVAATLSLPLFLLHGRGIADGLITLVAVLFLARSAAMRDWAWLRRGWVRTGAAWWVWIVLCSALAGHALGEAVALVRFLLLAAALQFWVLRTEWVRIWLLRLLRWAAFYIALQCMVQFVTGRNLFGWPRGSDGELTGPYKNPRAGTPLSRLLFPALLPLARTPLRGLLLLGGGIGVMVLIGQRIPLLLSFLGLFATALFIRQLRLPVLFTAVAAGVLLAALPLISPQASHRLESEFSRQMMNFPESPYGIIAARAVAIVRAHPVFGAGFDGFRRLCPDSRYFQGWDGGDGGAAAMCVQHPHNFYLQALVEGGAPGLLLFAGLAFVWLVTCGRGLLRRPEPVRVGLWVGVLIQLWPVASSTDWVSMPQAGWFFVLLGLALAEADLQGAAT